MTDTIDTVRHFQIRLYEIHPDRMSDFLSGWIAGVVPLRRQFGFSIDGAWVGEDGIRFLWIVSHQDAEAFRKNESEYYDSPERKALDPDPGRYIRSKMVIPMAAVAVSAG